MWATFVVGVVAAGFLAIIILPPAMGIVVVGHALIAGARHIARRYSRLE